MIQIIRAKLHGLRVTGADLHYHGSITLDPEICRHCSARIFWECKTAPGADDPANQPQPTATP